MWDCKRDLRAGGAREGGVFVGTQRGRGGGPGPGPPSSAAKQIPKGWRGSKPQKARIRKRGGRRDLIPNATNAPIPGSHALESERCCPSIPGSSSLPAGRCFAHGALRCMNRNKQHIREDESCPG